jgi:hypothetical protein
MSDHGDTGALAETTMSDRGDTGALAETNDRSHENATEVAASLHRVSHALNPILHMHAVDAFLLGNSECSITVPLFSSFVLAVYEDFGPHTLSLHYTPSTWGNASGFAAHRRAIGRAISQIDEARGAICAVFAGSAWSVFGDAAQHLLRHRDRVTLFTQDKGFSVRGPTFGVRGRTLGRVFKRVVPIPYLPYQLDACRTRPYIHTMLNYDVVFLGSKWAYSASRSSLRHVMKLMNSTTFARFGERQMQTPDEVIDVMSRSAFCLVPSGDTAASRRLFDAMSQGCILIFLDSDAWLPKCNSFTQRQHFRLSHMDVKERRDDSLSPHHARDAQRLDEFIRSVNQTQRLHLRALTHRASCECYDVLNPMITLTSYM